jgi:hypothetical protein
MECKEPSFTERKESNSSKQESPVSLYTKYQQNLFMKYATLPY